MPFSTVEPSFNQTLWCQLTSNEKAVARLALRGATKKQIGVERGISAATVNDYLGAIYRKLRVSDRCAMFCVLTGVEPYNNPDNHRRSA